MTGCMRYPVFPMKFFPGRYGQEYPTLLKKIQRDFQINPRNYVILAIRIKNKGIAEGYLCQISFYVTTPTNKFVGIYACTVDRVLATDCSPNPSMFLAALTSAFSE